jgi:hypothetical protein
MYRLHATDARHVDERALKPEIEMERKFDALQVRF